MGHGLRDIKFQWTKVVYLFHKYEFIASDRGGDTSLIGQA